MSLRKVTKSGLSIFLHGVISLPEAMSCDKTIGLDKQKNFSVKL